MIQLEKTGKSASEFSRSNREAWCVYSLFAIFLLVNLLTASRYPFVWIDEVMYTDPAANLYLGQGFTSSAWYVQHAHEFWAGNVPLHSALLYLWIKVFGLSITAVRSINYFYICASAWCLWQASLKLKLIVTPWARLLLIIAMFCGYSMIFSYRAGRPDCIALLLVCAAVYAYSRDCWRQRILGLMALGFLMPWAGLQLLPLITAGGLVTLVFAGRRVFKPLVALGCGAALGGAAVYGFFVSHGVWERFLASIRQHMTLGFFGWLARGHLRHSNLTPKDFSFMVIFVWVVLMAGRQVLKWRGLGGQVLAFFRKSEMEISDATMRAALIWFGLVFSMAVTVALLATGKFPTYYGWMTYVPLCVCVCGVLSRMPAGLDRQAGIAFMAAACVLGLGLHGVTAGGDWADRDYAGVEKFVGKNVTGADWMYGDFPSYYAAKRATPHVFMPLYAFLEAEKQTVTVLVISPTNLTEVTNVIGGNWKPVDRLKPASDGFWASRRNMGFLSVQNYDLQVYRRAEDR